jgi:hypothetical protein
VTLAAGLFGVLAAAVSLSLCGEIALRFLPPFDPPLRRFARLSLAFLLGCGLVGTWRIVLDLLGVRIGLLTTFAPAIPAAWLALRRGKRWDSPPHEPSSALSRSLALATAFFCALAFAETVARPLFDGDQVTNWGIKARVLHESGRFDLGAVPWLEIRAPGDHPPLAPMLLALVHDFAGGVDNDTTKLFYALFLPACLGLLDGALGPLASPLARRAGALAFAATPVVLDNASNGLVDLPLLAFEGGGLLLLACGAAPVGIALTAFGVLLKAEGIVLAFVNLAVALAFARGRARRGVLAGALACGGAFLLSETLRRAYGYERLSLNLFGPHAWARASAIARAFAGEFFRIKGSSGWGLYLLLVPAGALALGPALRRGSAGFLFAGFVGALLAQGAIYFVYPGDLRWQLPLHLTRAVLHGALAAAGLVALAFDACARTAVTEGGSPLRSR